MPLDLVIPDLLLPEDAPARLREVRLPNAEKWLARASATREPGSDALHWLARHHGMEEPVPVAAIARLGEGGEAAGRWLRADPVHLRVDNDGLVLHDAAILSLSLEEARALADALAAQFAPDGLAFEVLAPERWYVRHAGEAPRTVALARALGRNVFGLLPKGVRGLSWANLLTEAQMVLAAHAVNEGREPAANSIWFWGEGEAPASLPRRYDAICADEPFARGVAMLSGARAAPRAEGPGAIDAHAEDRVFALVDSLTPALRRGDTAGWLEAAARLDSAWFAGLGAAIARFGAVRIILPGEGATHVASLTASSRWRWFRPRRPVMAHA